MLAKNLYRTALTIVACLLATGPVAFAQHVHDHHVNFTVRSVKDGKWSDAKSWEPARVPGKDDRVLVARGTKVEYDVSSKAVLRMIQVVGTLSFARDRDTELNVGLVKVQNSDTCSEGGFACDFAHTTKGGEPGSAPAGTLPSLLIGTPEEPIPAKHTARIRLHYLEGMNKDDAPVIACCSARMEIHGSPIGQTWTELGDNAKPGDDKVVITESPTGWRIGDEIIVTASKRGGSGSYREGARRSNSAQTETRRIKAIDGNTLTLDKPLEFEHYGTGEFTSEVANLSRNVIVESADPAGVRGHTVYHRYSQGGISYARFAHLGKEGVLGRYAIHFHLVGDTMRGSSVQGVAIVDSHNRWVTIHGTQYLVVRDCVGFQSVGHGYFLEDGTEIYNLLDHNLGVQSYRGPKLKGQVLPFDENDGAAFWWANGRNTLVRNTGCENDQYGFRFDIQHSKAFDSHLNILQPNGQKETVDVRTIGIWRFEDNEAHTNFAGMVVAANGGNQPDVPVRDAATLAMIKRVDWTGPDTKHPHIIRNFTTWQSHYAFRPHSPCMLMDGLRIDGAAYGVYRPAFENHVYRNVHISHIGPEPFNRGMDDASAQTGSITVDGLRFDNLAGGDQGHPAIHMSDLNLSGTAASHFRNVTWQDDKPRRPVFNRGGSTRVDPFIDQGVPYYVHDYFGPGRHARIISTKAKDLLSDGLEYRQLPPLTGDESVVAEVSDVKWPELLQPIDDVPPATIITTVLRGASQVTVRGVSHDNGEIVSIAVNGQPARITSRKSGVVDWEATLDASPDAPIIAFAKDDAGNTEQTAHRLPAASNSAGHKHAAE